MPLPCLAIRFCITVFHYLAGSMVPLFFRLAWAWRHASRSVGSMFSIPHSFLSFVIVSSHVFLGRPRGMFPSTCSVVTLLIQSLLLDTWPNHLSLLSWTENSMGDNFNLLSRATEETRSSRRTLHIHLIMALSVRRRRSMSFTVDAQHSAPWRSTLRTQIL